MDECVVLGKQGKSQSGQICLRLDHLEEKFH